MSHYLKRMITRRLKNVTFNELMTYSEMYGFSISEDTALEIVHYLRNLSLDPFQRRDREQMFNDLTLITDIQTANNVRQLFEQLIQQYHIEHLFDD